jgi:hypothetical protein
MGEEWGPQVVFQLVDPASAETSPEVLGLWAMAPTPAATAVSFGVGGESVADVPIWRANLPAELSAADTQLTSAERNVQAARAALGVAPARLQGFIEARPAGVTFDTSAAERAWTAPEAELWELLGEIREGRPPVSFGLGERLLGGWKQAAQQFQLIVDRLRQFSVPHARIETRIQEEWLGQTTVGWMGDMQTAWREAISPEEVGLHQRTLTLALETHVMLLRTFVVATQFAAKLALLVGTPSGVILALPAAWKFINRVIAEIGPQQ